jgi:mannan endo-1,4-beta-mannosidase
MAGAEGSGMINGVMRVGPPLQPEQGQFDERALDGLDIVLAEMAQRDMKAVIFLSNNWEWSGGFQQYVDWNGLVPNELKGRALNWDELREMVGRFYVCRECKDGYIKQLRYVFARTNKITGRKYTDDATIMSWELANEPRPMWPALNERYAEWIRDVAAEIKSLDRKHLVTIGHEGSIGTQSMEFFEQIHRDPNIDYLTIHIWAKNWQWYTENNFQEAFPKAEEYIKQHIEIAQRLRKPLVIEEFGLPRDVVGEQPKVSVPAMPQSRKEEADGVSPPSLVGSASESGQQSPARLSFDPATPTTLRDEYYRRVFSYIGGPVAGANFWAFGGTARPIPGQVFWKVGDEYMGDPPMEEQGLNTVFDSDASTFQVIRAAATRARRLR